MGFTVQLEVLFEKRWTSIVRHDMAHGTPTRRTKKLLALSPGEALTYADRDVTDHWVEYALEFFRRNAR